MSQDLTSAFPDMKGFSPTNLKYMKMFAEGFSSDEIGQQAADQLPWFHIVTIFGAVKDIEARKFYIQKARECGWSRNILSIQIETNLYGRQGKIVSNFKEALPAPQLLFSRT